MTKMMTTTMTAMEPSSSSSGSSNAAPGVTHQSRLFSSRSSAMEEPSSSSSSSYTQQKQQPQLDPNQPNLYMIPQSLSPTYRPIPMVVKLCTMLISSWVSIVTTWKKQRITWFQPLAILMGMKVKPTIKEWLLFAFKTVLFTILSQMIAQDLFYAPTRISTSNLKSNYCSGNRRFGL